MKTKSGATAVQFAYLSRRGSRDIEHLGSAHDQAELEALMAAARPRGSWSSTWALSLRPAGRCRSPSRGGGDLLDVLERAYLVLGHAISGRQLAHDLFRRVLLPRSQSPGDRYLIAEAAAQCRDKRLPEGMQAGRDSRGDGLRLESAAARAARVTARLARAHGGGSASSGSRNSGRVIERNADTPVIAHGRTIATDRPRHPHYYRRRSLPIGRRLDQAAELLIMELTSLRPRAYGRRRRAGNAAARRA